MSSCPKCNGRSRVYDTRRQRDGTVLRRRQCKRGSCFVRFNTVERITKVKSPPRRGPRRVAASPSECQSPQ